MIGDLTKLFQELQNVEDGCEVESPEIYVYDEKEDKTYEISSVSEQDGAIYVNIDTRNNVSSD